MTTKAEQEKTVVLEPIEISMDDYADIVDVNEATWAYLNAFEEDELRDKLFPYVRAAMVCLQRSIVRRVEEDVFSGDGAGLRAESAVAGLLANRLALLNQTFSLADGTRVEWLKATIAQHRERAEMQRRLAGNCLVDAERHEQAAKLIKKFKVTCLAEIQS